MSAGKGDRARNCYNDRFRGNYDGIEWGRGKAAPGNGGEAAPAPGELPRTWKEYQFPEWVPEKVRQELREFWAEKFGRSPREWHRGTVLDPYNRHPALGTEVTCEIRWGAREGLAANRSAGKWVPMWNNIGRLVRADGTVRVASTLDIVKGNGNGVEPVPTSEAKRT